MEKAKKNKKFRKKIGYLAILAISFGLVVFMSVGATLAWFAGSDWADNTMYMGGPVYISMYGEDNTGRKLTSGFGNLEVSAATDSRTTGITSLTGDEENDKKVLLPGQRMEIHAVARLKSSVYETSYRRSSNTDGLQTGIEGELSRSTNALLRARFALNVKFDSDTAVGESDFYTLPTTDTKPDAATYAAAGNKYKYYVSGPGAQLPGTPYDIINGVKTPAEVGTIVEDNTNNDVDSAGTEYKNYYYEITIKSTNIITPDGREWSLPQTDEGNVNLGVGGKIWAWTRLDGYGNVITPYANSQDLINALNTNMMQLIVESNAVGLAKGWGWRYIPEAESDSTDVAVITLPDGTTTYNIGYDNNGAGSGDVAGWWYLVKTDSDIAVGDNLDFSLLNTDGNAEMFEIDTRNYTTGNSYNGEGGAANEIPFVDGEFVLPGDMLDNIYGNAKIDFKVTFQAIQAFLPWQSTQESNYKIGGTGKDTGTATNADLGKGKDLTIGNAYIIFDEAFNNEAYKATQKPSNSQGSY